MFVVRFLAALVLCSVALESFSSAHVQVACDNNLGIDRDTGAYVNRPSLQQNGPILLFVHGLNSNHSTWIGNNRYVERACRDGYRVFAVDLGPRQHTCDNGALLAKTLERVQKSHQGELYVVAHSKGGIDAQTAAAIYGVAGQVSGYLTFGTPYAGSRLADIACATFVPRILGCSDAVMSLRRGYMASVREVVDAKPEMKQLPATSARGATTRNSWRLRVLGIFEEKPNDGMVSTRSAGSNPFARQEEDRDLNHFNVHHAQRYSDWQELLPDRRVAPVVLTMGEALRIPETRELDQLLRAGELVGEIIENVPVEANVEEITFQVITSVPSRVVVRDASEVGVYEEREAAQTSSEDIFDGYVYDLSIKAPEQGEWTVKIDALEDSAFGQESAYLMNVSFTGGVRIQLEGVQWLYDASVPSELSIDGELDFEIEYLRFISDDAASSIEEADIQRQDLGEVFMQIKKRPGVYTLELSVRGVASFMEEPEGGLFERTHVETFAVWGEDGVVDLDCFTR